MAIDGVCVLEYAIEYPTLNLKAKKDSEKTFDYGFLYCYSKECEKGFKVKKVGKTTKKGTKFTYTSIKDQKDFKEYEKTLKQMISNFNCKYGANLEVQ